MKRLVLLSVGALMLAATVFAPVASAQESFDVDVQSVTLGTGGTLNITGTFECTEGNQYFVYAADVRQTTGNRPYNSGNAQYPENGIMATCETASSLPFTMSVVGQRPFKKGDVLVRTAIYKCDPFGFCTYTPSPTYEEFRIR